MMDLIQFLDNIRPAYSGLQWPVVTVWNPTNMSGPDCLSQSHNLTISQSPISDCLTVLQGLKARAGWTTTTSCPASTTRWLPARDRSRPARPRRPPTTRPTSPPSHQPREGPACWWCLSPSTLPR